MFSVHDKHSAATGEMMMTSQFKPRRLHARSAWISDIHLGNKDCKAEYLLDLLDNLHCDILYLAGDIIDLWSLSKSFHWPATHNQIVRKIMEKSREGCRVIYIPGNHDHTFREYAGQSFGGIEVHLDYVHTSLHGQRFLVTHGDELDNVIRFNPLLKIIGDHAYDFLLFLHRWNNRVRKHMNRDYWSLAGHIKTRIGKARKAINTFEEAAMELARNKGFDGIICGHIHHPNIRKMANIHYFNDGDWIENCTVMIETRDGRFEILHWSERIHYQQQIEVEPLRLPL